MNVSQNTNNEIPPKVSKTSPAGKNTLNETSTSDNLYDSALENVTIYKSFNESANNNSRMNSSTDFESNVNDNIFNKLNETPFKMSDLNTNINASMLLIQSESTDTNTSQDEVDPKSQLANKTIFKTNNPNLSIIEISDNSIKEEDIHDSVLLIESSSEDEVTQTKLSTDISIAPVNNSSAEKRRKKAETLLNCSKQKLNLAIAEASAQESWNAKEKKTNIRGIASMCPPSELPKTKNEIKIYETIEEFEKNLPSTVTILETPFGSKVYLVGTAHFSEESQDDVSFVIRNVRPDVVMVELCPSRIHILKLDEKTLLEEAKNFGLDKFRSIIQSHGYINGAFFILLLHMSAQIAKDLGMAPGGEFRRAFEEITKIPGCTLQLGDRPIRVTLHRALRALSFWQTLKLVWRLTFSDSISIEEIEECKQRDLLEKLMEELAGEFPAFAEVFVKERDIFLCHSLQLSSLPHTHDELNNILRPVRVVGVVGIGHAQGIAKMWGSIDPTILPSISEIPPTSTSTKVCLFTLKYGLIGLTLFGAYKFFRPRLPRLF